MSNEGDTPDQAQPAAAGPFAAGEAPDRTAAELGRGPRRVMLRHDDTGSYCIFMGGRMIQGFCQEFEEITGYSIGVNTQQQVRIHIDPIGRRQQARYPDRGDDPPDVENQIMRATPAEEGALFSTAHPGNPTITMTWQDEAREHLVREIEQRQALIDMLAGM